MTSRLRPVLLMIWLTFHPAPASAQYCNEGHPLWSTSAFPIWVYLNVNMVDVCNGADTDCTGVSDISYVLRSGLSEFYQTGSSIVRFVYAGTTTIPPGTYHPNANTIHIYAFTGCNGPGAGFMQVSGSGGVTDKGKVGVCVTNSNGPVPYDPWTLQHVMMHEIGHVLSMAHPSDCSLPDKSIMGGTGYTATAHLHRYDINWLQNRYGNRPNNARVKYSSDMLSWGAITDPMPPLTAYSLGRMAATNSRSGVNVYVAHGDDRYRTINIWRYGVGDVSTVYLGVTDYHTGIANQDNMQVSVGWLGSYTTATGVQSVYKSLSNDYANSWAPPIEISTAATRTNSSGVAATYDANSGHYIFMWRRGDGTGTNIHQILYRVDGFSLVFSLEDPSGNPIRAADTPTIACGVVGLNRYDCLLAWVESGWTRTVKWAHVYVDGLQGDLEFHGNIETLQYLACGSPSVTFHGNATYPWAILLNQCGNTTFSWRKTNGYAAPFQDLRSFSLNQVVTLPAAATRAVKSGSLTHAFLLDR